MNAAIRHEVYCTSRWLAFVAWCVWVVLELWALTGPRAVKIFIEPAWIFGICVIGVIFSILFSPRNRSAN